MSSIPIITKKLLPAGSKHNFTNLVTFVFLVLGIIGILNHAMWRDELNVWLITRDSASLFDLFYNIKYEGHPALWYLCLYFLNQFTSNPVAMQILHLFIATAAIYIFTKYSPFTPIQKLLFTLGYLPFYEYLVISRNYVIGLLLLFSFCSLFHTRTKNYLWLSLILFLLANSNAYCLFISIALAVTLIVEYSLGKKINLIKTSIGNAICSLTIFLLGVVSSLVLLIPPADSTLQGGLNQWMFQLDFKHLVKSITRIWNGYIVILVPSDRYLDLGVFALLSLFFIAFVVTLLIRKPVALFLYLFATIELLAFTYVKFLGAPRHYGHFYLILIVALWIASYYQNNDLLLQPLTNLSSQFKKYLLTWMKFVKKHKTTFLMIILSAQLLGGIVAFSRDLLIPYSSSREVASFIKSQKLEQMFIVGSRDANVSPIAGYLNRKIYYPEKQGMGSFVLFNSKRKELNAATVLEQVSQIIKEKQDILLILNSELKNSRPDLDLAFVAKFTHNLVESENYYLYKVKASAKS